MNICIKITWKNIFPQTWGSCPVKQQKLVYKKKIFSVWDATLSQGDGIVWYTLFRTLPFPIFPILLVNSPTYSSHPHHCLTDWEMRYLSSSKYVSAWSPKHAWQDLLKWYTKEGHLPTWQAPWETKEPPSNKMLLELEV